MKVKIVDVAVSSLDDLNCGEVFAVDGLDDMFMKINGEECEIDSNAVSLKTGRLQSFGTYRIVNRAVSAETVVQITQK